MFEKIESELAEELRENAVYYIPVEKIRVSKEQENKTSRDKIEKHKKFLAKQGDDLLPIDANELEDGTFIIDGNGRHKYFAYLEMGYKLIPLNIKQRKNFKPTQ